MRHFFKPEEMATLKTMWKAGISLQILRDPLNLLRSLENYCRL
jgi:hypothetical protein